MVRLIPLALAALILAGCNSSGRPVAATVAPPTEADRAALLDRIKTLQGEWVGDGPDGGTSTTVIAVSSNGSAVREIMFPGTAHEMTNMYHMDGRSLLMTHYCAAGNQPRMRARAGGDPSVIRFEFDGVSNHTAADEAYMGSMVLSFVDADHIRQEWTSYQNGEVAHTAVFDLARKR